MDKPDKMHRPMIYVIKYKTRFNSKERSYMIPAVNAQDAVAAFEIISDHSQLPERKAADVIVSVETVIDL